MRVLVLGGGVFGCLTAIDLAQAGFQVELMERRSALLMGASRCNQGRLHMGYHYPRSLETALVTGACAPKFAARFPEAINRQNRHYYCISASESSLTNGDEYLEFCRQARLDYQIASPPVGLEFCQLSLQVPEAFIDIGDLRELISAELEQAGVSVRLNADGRITDTTPADWTVDATYGRIGLSPRLRYELCEIVLVRLPAEFARLSIVVLDGPFFSLDPIPGTPYHYLYGVQESLHWVAEGVYPHLNQSYQRVADRGVVQARGLSHFDQLRERVQWYLPEVRKAEYLGSLFTVRAILADVDASDARPTLISRPRERLIVLVGGKLDNAIMAGRQVLDAMTLRV